MAPFFVYQSQKDTYLDGLAATKKVASSLSYITSVSMRLATQNTYLTAIRKTGNDRVKQLIVADITAETARINALEIRNSMMQRSLQVTNAGSANFLS